MQMQLKNNSKKIQNLKLIFSSKDIFDIPEMWGPGVRLVCVPWCDGFQMCEAF